MSLPVSLSAWYWGKILGRYTMVFLLAFLAMLGAIAWGVYQGAELPWDMLIYYTALLMALAWCFLGIGMLISTIARSSDVVQGAAFVV